MKTLYQSPHFGLGVMADNKPPVFNPCNAIYYEYTPGDRHKGDTDDICAIYHAIIALRNTTSTVRLYPCLIFSKNKIDPNNYKPKLFYVMTDMLKNINALEEVRKFTNYTDVKIAPSPYNFIKFTVRGCISFSYHDSDVPPNKTNRYFEEFGNAGVEGMTLLRPEDTDHGDRHAPHNKTKFTIERAAIDNFFTANQPMIMLCSSEYAKSDYYYTKPYRSDVEIIDLQS